MSGIRYGSEGRSQCVVVCAQKGCDTVASIGGRGGGGLGFTSAALDQLHHHDCSGMCLAPGASFVPAVYEYALANTHGVTLLTYKLCAVLPDNEYLSGGEEEGEAVFGGVEQGRVDRGIGIS